MQILVIFPFPFGVMILSFLSSEMNWVMMFVAQNVS